jgi:hypothetical protein
MKLMDLSMAGLMKNDILGSANTQFHQLDGTNFDVPNPLGNQFFVLLLWPHVDIEEK